MTTLIGDPHGNGIGGLVGDYYAKCGDPVKKEKIETLVNQIKNLHNSGDYKTAGEDPYRLPARINLLAYLCDLTPCFNCKSGKDRTGQMDVSTKELALSLEMKRSNISLKTGDDEERKNMLTNMSLNSGNLEVQAQNTVFSGFKIKGVNAVKNLYGDNYTNFRGLSTLIKA